MALKAGLVGAALVLAMVGCGRKPPAAPPAGPVEVKAITVEPSDTVTYADKVGMVFVAVGMIAGPIGLGYLREGINAPLVKVLAEVTLVLVLCFDQPQYATRRATSVNSFR